MLESLRQGAGTIHELNLAGTFPERAPYRPREVYAALKRTPLFDAERGQWNFSMSEDQIVEDEGRASAQQLLGVLAEAQFNPVKAWARYEQLKTAPRYDAARGQWDSQLSEKQMLPKMNRRAVDQLLGILAEAQCNLEEARIRYKELKATPLYDRERGQWNWGMSAEQREIGTYRHPDAQLLGVLVEAHFDAETARVLYEKLKRTPLYDPERRQWNWWMSNDQVLLSTSRYAVAQLLGVLVEAQFNGESARGLYEQLIATPLYDPERGQWNELMSDEQIAQRTLRRADKQLLGVLVEAKLLSTLPVALAENVPPLPVTEDW